MIIRRLHLVGVAVFEAKADPILSVDVDGPLPLTISAQLVQPISWRPFELFDALRTIQQRQLYLCPLRACSKTALDRRPSKSLCVSLSPKLLITNRIMSRNA